MLHMFVDIRLEQQLSEVASADGSVQLLQTLRRTFLPGVQSSAAAPLSAGRVRLAFPLGGGGRGARGGGSGELLLL